MSTEHTPGPWFDTYDDNGFFHIQGSDPAHRPSPYIAATSGEDDVDKANALLIAGAPCLLEALIDAVKIIREHVPIDALGTDSTGDLTEHHLTYSWPILEEHLSYMDDAINIAKGVN